MSWFDQNGPEVSDGDAQTVPERLGTRETPNAIPASMQSAFGDLKQNTLPVVDGAFAYVPQAASYSLMLLQISPIRLPLYRCTVLICMRYRTYHLQTLAEIDPFLVHYDL